MSIGFGKHFVHRRTGEEYVLNQHFQHSSDTVFGGITLAEYGIGVVVLPNFIAPEHLSEKSLTRILPDWAYPGPDIHMVYPSRRQLPQKTRALIDLSAEMLRRK